MNQRIRELAEQAIANVRFWKGCNQESYDVDEHELAKFAELIIRECSGILRKEADSQWEGREGRLLKAMASWIEQHFG